MRLSRGGIAAVALLGVACSSTKTAPEETCALCRAPAITCSRGAGVESVTLYVSGRSASGCNAEASSGVGAEKLRINCNPLEACTSNGACYGVAFEGGEAKFATAAWTYVCWPDEKP